MRSSDCMPSLFKIISEIILIRGNEITIAPKTTERFANSEAPTIKPPEIRPLSSKSTQIMPLSMQDGLKAYRQRVSSPPMGIILKFPPDPRSAAPSDNVANIPMSAILCDNPNQGLPC